jgi:glycosyltransferase involved in cell wall biosynthesis
VDLAKALLKGGFDVRHFYLVFPPWQIGAVENSPIPSQGIEVPEYLWTIAEIQRRVATEVEWYAPDVCLITDSWSLKPWLAGALSGLPYVLRFDAMECLCPLNNLRIIPETRSDLRACFTQRLATPRTCFDCVTKYGELVGTRHQMDRLLSRFDTCEYHELLIRTLRSAHAVLVLNPLIAAHLEPYASDVHVVPIGVDEETFGQVPPLAHASDCEAGVVRILFAGRTTDAVKGFKLLQAACEKLWSHRHDFRVMATEEADPDPRCDFVEWTGRRPHHQMPELLAKTDILVAPSLVNEPFGLSVVEAMAAGRPVVASQTGGHMFTVVDGVTGLLFRPADEGDLEAKLSRLLDSVELRVELGSAGRRRFLSEYTWARLVDRYYRPLLTHARKA